MRAVLLGAVHQSFYEKKILRKFFEPQLNDLLIGVDGGTELWKEWGIQPHFAIGDWDSLGKKKNILNTIPHLTLDKHKERSDLFYAGLFAICAGATELLCLGVTGGRPDHHLSNLLELSSLSNGDYGHLDRVESYGADANYFFLSSAIPNWQQKVKSSTLVSVFALNELVTGLDLFGFQYPMRKGILHPGSHGLSNLTRNATCRVSIERGQLVIVVPKVEKRGSRG